MPPDNLPFPRFGGKQGEFVLFPGQTKKNIPKRRTFFIFRNFQCRVLSLFGDKTHNSVVKISKNEKSSPFWGIFFVFRGNKKQFQVVLWIVEKT